MKNEYYQLTGIQLTDSFGDQKTLYHYQQLRQQYTFEQLLNMNIVVSAILTNNTYNWRYTIDDTNESTIVAHIKRINEKNGYPSYKRQFSKQAKEILSQYQKGQIRWALHKAENMKLDNEIGFTFIKSLIDKENNLSS